MDTRDAQVLGRHVEGLPGLQRLRDALDGDGPVAAQLAEVFDAAVAHFRVEQSLRALLLTDPELNLAHRRMAASTGLGPQLPVEEIAEWLRGRRVAGDIDADVDARAAATLICGAADYVATIGNTVASPVAEAAHGGHDRLVAGLLPVLGLPVRAGALAE